MLTSGKKVTSAKWTRVPKVRNSTSALQCNMKGAAPAATITWSEVTPLPASHRWHILQLAALTWPAEQGWILVVALPKAPQVFKMHFAFWWENSEIFFNTEMFHILLSLIGWKEEVLSTCYLEQTNWVRGGTTPKICCSAVEVGPASGTSVLHLSGNTTQQQPFIYWWHKGRYLISTIIFAHRQKQFTFPYLSVQILLPTTCSLETEQLPNDFLLIYPAEVTRATLVFQNGCLFVTQTHFSANYRLTVLF